MSIENLFKESVLTWGNDAQWRQLQEECAELIAAVNQVVFRGRDPSEKILEELAGVQLMLNQIKWMLQCPEALEEAYKVEQLKCWDQIYETKRKAEEEEGLSLTKGTSAFDPTEQSGVKREAEES